MQQRPEYAGKIPEAYSRFIREFRTIGVSMPNGLPSESALREQALAVAGKQRVDNLKYGSSTD